MVNKKLSGQSIAIIILAILLLLTIGFGGVYAYYTTRSNNVSGQIVMANLKITLNAKGSSDGSIIQVSFKNDGPVVPGQSLNNYELSINNMSSVAAYMVIVYELDATKIDEDGNKIYDEEGNEAKPDLEEVKFKKPVLGLGFEYINAKYPEYNSSYNVKEKIWADYVFDASQVQHADKEDKQYRCIVTLVAVEKESEQTVIPANKLALSSEMGNEYQNTMISLTFQAFAIAATSDNFKFTPTTTNATKCKEIVEAVYISQDCQFFKS